MMHWFFRMARWARNPPSAKQVRLVFALITLCLAIYAIEAIFGWPEALTPTRITPRGPT